MTRGGVRGVGPAGGAGAAGGSGPAGGAGGVAPGRHAHVAPVADGLLVTVGTRRLRVALPADALDDADGRAQVRAALEERLGPLRTWAPREWDGASDGERDGASDGARDGASDGRWDGASDGATHGDAGGPAAETDAPPAVWWWGGAWWACARPDADPARRVVRTHAPDAATAAAWTTAGCTLDLPAAPDPDRAAAVRAAAAAPPGTLVRSVDGRVSTHPLRPWPAVDDVTGVVRALVVRPAEPGLPLGFRHAHGVLPRTGLGWPGWQADPLAPAAVLGCASDVAGAHADDDRADVPSDADADADVDADTDVEEVVPVPAGADVGAAVPDPVAPDVREAVLASAVAHLAGPWTGAAPVTTAPRATLDAAGQASVDPDLLAVTDPAVVADPRSPLRPLDPARPLAWVRGVRAADGAPVQVPARVAHTYVDPGAVADQPASGFPNLVGVGAARTRADAVRVGLAHVVAHDAVARWWRTADAPPPPVLAPPAALADAWSGADVALDLRALPAPAGWVVVLAVVRDAERGLLATGHGAAPCTAPRTSATTRPSCAAGPTPSRTEDSAAGVEHAARTAATDALVQLVTARDLDRPDSRLRAAQAAGLGDVPGLLAHRPDRTYLDAVPPLPDAPAVRPGLLDPLVHLQVGLDPRIVAHVERRLRTAPLGAAVSRAGRPTVGVPGVAPPAAGVPRAVDLADLPAPPTTDVPDPATAVVVDVTPPALAGRGWHAVRVLVPGALRLEPGAFPVRAPAGRRETLPWPGW